MSDAGHVHYDLPGSFNQNCVPDPKATITTPPPQQQQQNTPTALTTPEQAEAAAAEAVNNFFVTKGRASQPMVLPVRPPGQRFTREELVEMAEEEQRQQIWWLTTGKAEWEAKQKLELDAQQQNAAEI